MVVEWSNVCSPHARGILFVSPISPSLVIYGTPNHSHARAHTFPTPRHVSRFPHQLRPSRSASRMAFALPCVRRRLAQKSAPPTGYAATSLGRTKNTQQQKAHTWPLTWVGSFCVPKVFVRPSFSFPPPPRKKKWGRVTESARLNERAQSLLVSRY